MERHRAGREDRGDARCLSACSGPRTRSGVRGTRHTVARGYARRPGSAARQRSSASASCSYGGPGGAEPSIAVLSAARARARPCTRHDRFRLCRNRAVHGGASGDVLLHRKWDAARGPCIARNDRHWNGSGDGCTRGRGSLGSRRVVRLAPATAGSEGAVTRILRFAGPAFVIAVGAALVALNA